MSTWTRAHDAHIARECEGLEVEQFSHLGGAQDYGVKTSRMPMRHPSQAYTSIPHYLTDPAAAIRAAEAWVEKAPDTRSIQYQYFGRAQKLVTVWDVERGRFIEQSATTAAALAKALYRATGGPA